MKVNEIFYSIQGESTFSGLPCVFVRLTGCNLRCNYCDTRYAYENGAELTISDVLSEVRKFDCFLVEITGGEPLLQAETVELVRKLIAAGNQVLIETNGTMDISVLPEGVIRIMDVKCPGSGEFNKMNQKNIEELNWDDNVKFVISNKDDFDWAEGFVRQFDLISKTNVLFSPCFGEVAPEVLAKWILQSNLPVRMQLQLHKYIWDPNKRGV